MAVINAQSRSSRDGYLPYKASEQNGVEHVLGISGELSTETIRTPKGRFSPNTISQTVTILFLSKLNTLASAESW